MAEKVIIKNKETGEAQYPVTHEACILTEDGKSLSGKIDASKRAVFDDLWKAACGVYGSVDYSHYEGERHTPYYLNELWLTYEEAAAVYNAGAIDSTQCQYKYFNLNIRTNLPPMIGGATYGGGRQDFFPYTLIDNSQIEVLNVKMSSGSFRVAVMPVGMNNTSYFQAPKLRKIIGTIVIGQTTSQPTYGNYLFGNCPLLEEVDISAMNLDLNLSKLPSISADSIKFLLSKRIGTNTITLSLHPDIYAKITSEEGDYAGIMDLAESKNVSLASA